jgi:hypothetical protein
VLKIQQQAILNRGCLLFSIVEMSAAAVKIGAVKPQPSSMSAPSSMDPMFAPFQFLRVPDFKLRYPTSLPSWTTVFAITFVVYYLITAGIIYDRIVEPPAIGSEQDPRTGAVKPVVFVQYRVNGQFIIEVCFRGFLCFILTDTGFGDRVCLPAFSSHWAVLV